MHDWASIRQYALYMFDNSDVETMDSLSANWIIYNQQEEFYRSINDDYHANIYATYKQETESDASDIINKYTWIEGKPIKVTTINGVQYYDYSTPINRMIMENAELCLQHRAQFTDEWYIPNSVEFALNMKKLYDSMDWFVDMDGSGAPWDIKNPDQWHDQLPYCPFLGLRGEFVLNGQLQHAEGVGNIAFGYWARALGFGPDTIYYGAGWAQINGTKTIGSLLDERLAQGPLYGDIADDHSWVNQGIDWYDSQYPNDGYVVNTNPAKVYAETTDAIKQAIIAVLESVVII